MLEYKAKDKHKMDQRKYRFKNLMQLYLIIISILNDQQLSSEISLKPEKDVKMLIQDVDKKIVCREKTILKKKKCQMCKSVILCLNRYL